MIRLLSYLLLASGLMCFAPAASAQSPETAERVEDVSKLSYAEFDQRPGKGWRALSDQKQFKEAARMIEVYLAKRADLNVRDRANLHFHAAQCLAFDGGKASIEQALAHLKDAKVEPEPPDSPVKWNDYVSATEAFLKHDLKALKSAREKIAQGPKLDGEIPNLKVVDRLIAGFDQPYAEAYGGR